MRRDQNGQLQVGPVREIEADLLEAQQSVARMIEHALAAFAAEHAVRVPEAGERGAPAAQGGNATSSGGLRDRPLRRLVHMHQWVEIRSGFGAFRR